MVHYYMYKKTNKIKKHRQIDKCFVFKFIAKQTNVQTNKQRHTENPLQNILHYIKKYTWKIIRMLL